MYLSRLLLARLLLASGVLAVLAVAPLSAQDEDEAALILFGSAGFLNSPEDFDVFRDVSYDSSIQVGGGIGLRLYENVTIRGDFAWVKNSGREAAPVSEDVDFRRLYFGASLELNLPLDSGLAPYVFGGGGFVALDRQASDYAYDVTEGAGLVGGGLRYTPPGSSVQFFAQGAAWMYTNHAVTELQTDVVISAGIGWVLPL